MSKGWTDWQKKVFNKVGAIRKKVKDTKPYVGGGTAVCEVCGTLTTNPYCFETKNGTIIKVCFPCKEKISPSARRPAKIIYTPM